MITITDESASGKDILMVGVVEGRTVGSLSKGHKIGTIEQHKAMIDKSKAAAVNQMIGEAKKMGADAIVCVRYSSAPDAKGSTEVTVSGTAVKYR